SMKINAEPVQFLEESVCSLDMTCGIPMSVNLVIESGTLLLSGHVHDVNREVHEHFVHCIISRALQSNKQGEHWPPVIPTEAGHFLNDSDCQSIVRSQVPQRCPSAQFDRLARRHGEIDLPKQPDKVGGGESSASMNACATRLELSGGTGSSLRTPASSR